MSTLVSRRTTQAEHEAFKTRCVHGGAAMCFRHSLCMSRFPSYTLFLVILFYSLVNDVFASDRVQMEKVMMLLWQFRDDPSVVQFMAQFVAKVSVKRCLAVSNHRHSSSLVDTNSPTFYIYYFSLREVAMSFEESNSIFRNWHT